MILFFVDVEKTNKINKDNFQLFFLHMRFFYLNLLKNPFFQQTLCMLFSTRMFVNKCMHFRKSDILYQNSYIFESIVYQHIFSEKFWGIISKIIQLAKLRTAKSTIIFNMVSNQFC